MNTKIQILNSTDLENVSGGDFIEAFANPFGICDVKWDLENKSLNWETNILYAGNFSKIFNNAEKISDRVGALTAFAVITGAAVGIYEATRWVIKKIF